MMSSRVLAALFLTWLAAGCRASEPEPRSPAVDPWAHVLDTRASGAPRTNDPWAGTSTPSAVDDLPLPSVDERRRLADDACPTVVAPYFYRVEKAGKVSHLLGTRHMGVGLEKFPDVVGASLRAARLVVLETAPDDDAAGAQPNIELADALGPTLWQHYRKLVGRAIVDGQARTAPAVAFVLITTLYEDFTAALDAEVARLAQRANIETAGLETSAFQHQLIAEFLDLRMLRAVLADTDDRQQLAEESHEELAAYCAGTDDTPGFDAEERSRLTAHGFSEAELARWEEHMIFARNDAWLPQLERMFAAGDVFVAVGADHLRGKRGVVSLLAARGYTVTRVRG